jgi:hypothetical protein
MDFHSGRTGTYNFSHLLIEELVFIKLRLRQILYQGTMHPWMKEVKGIRHGGRGAYLRCPVFTTVQFSLREEGSSEYIRVCEGRESLWPNF